MKVEVGFLFGVEFKDDLVAQPWTVIVSLLAVEYQWMLRYGRLAESFCGGYFLRSDTFQIAAERFVFVR